MPITRLVSASNLWASRKRVIGMGAPPFPGAQASSQAWPVTPEAVARRRKPILHIFVGVVCTAGDKRGGPRLGAVAAVGRSLEISGRSMPNRKIGRARYGRQRLTGAATEEGR